MMRLNSPKLMKIVRFLVLSIGLLIGRPLLFLSAELTSRDVQVESLLRSAISDIRQKEGEERFKRLAELNSDLATLRHKEGEFNTETRNKICDQLLTIWERVASSPQEEQTRQLIISMLARNGHNHEESRSLILRILDDGPDPLRDEIYSSLLYPTAIRGDDIYRKINELYAKGLINLQEKVTYLALINKERALPEILDVIANTDNKKTFIQTVMALQYYDRPALLKTALERVKDFNFKQTQDMDSGFFWIDRNMFAKYFEEAQGEDLLLALDVLNQGAGGTIDVAKIILLRDLLSHPDPMVRELSVEQLGREIDTAFSKEHRIEEILYKKAKGERNERVIKAYRKSLNLMPWEKLEK